MAAALHTDRAGPPGAIGVPMPRLEDRRLLTGQGQYLADLKIPGEAFVHFVRSPFASARIASLDLAAARALPGVVGVYSAEDLPDSGRLPVYPALASAAAQAAPPLAREVVRYVGEPVIAVVAESPVVASDAADLARIAYEPRPAVVTIDAALAEGAPAVHEAVPGNLAATQSWEAGDVDDAFAAAEHVVELAIRNGRVAPLPLEPRGGVARYDPATNEYTLWLSTQVPHRARSELVHALGIPESALRIVVPDVGGGFGAKVNAYPEDLALLLLARLVGRPVRWVSARREDLLTSMHARESLIEVAAAFSGDGHLEALRVRATVNVGAYLQPTGLVPPARLAVLVPGAYAVRHVASEVRCVYTNTTPTGPYRGAGRPEASFVIERVMDTAARDLGIDPVELRRRNCIPPDAFPYRTPTGQVYDSGDYARSLDRLLELAGYATLRAQQAAARARGELVGIGLSTFIEPSGGALWEGGHIRVERSGEITVFTGAGPHGQGSVTALAQIVADRLRVPVETIRVRHGDTAATPPGVGSFGSRTVVLAGSALARAAERVEAKARRIAAHLLECAPEDVERVAGGFGVAGATGRAVTLAQIAHAAYTATNLPDGEEPGLEATALYRQAEEMFPFGAYLAVVRIDPETGQVHLEHLVGVDDSGVIINPLLAHGQIQGAIVQGIGQALLEQIIYDASGQLVTGSLLDYAAPRADTIPWLRLDLLETPSPLNPLGAKGLGEAGTVGAPAAVINAVVDALAERGARQVDMPATAQQVWRLLRSGQG